MTTFSIKTLGCKVNQFESETLEQTLVECGCQPTDSAHEADICIINTCTVTQKASMQSRQAIRQAIRSHPNARILVTGCYAQTEPEAIRKITGVHEIVGHADKPRIPEILFQTGANRNPEACKNCISDTPLLPSSVICHPSSFPRHARTRPFLKIQDGCNAFCTYCIVPHARGRSRSLPPASVLESIRKLRMDGVHEVVLTGIHLGHYGHDLIPKTSLTELLAVIEAENLMERIRLSSIEPAEISDALIDRIADSRIFCRHFHIPLQSGDNMILRRMNRPYTREFFHALVGRIHDRIPDAAIGADVLVGFPGETDAAFQQTVSLIASLPITYLHVFPFSARKGTPAYNFTDKIPDDVVKHRCERLRAVGQAKKRAFYGRQIGKNVEILIEGLRDKATGLLKGVTSNYIPVLVEGGNDLRNSIILVQLFDFNDDISIMGIIK
jgi:threonylcarbamoyladenosine tRNA methylthiotransferase MtaB